MCKQVIHLVYIVAQYSFLLLKILARGGRETDPSGIVADGMQPLFRRDRTGQTGRIGHRGVPQLYAAPRRHHGSLRSAARQACRTYPLERQCRHPFGRCDDDLRLPPALFVRNADPAPTARHLQ